MKNLEYTVQSHNGYAYWLYNDMTLTDFPPHTHN